MSLDSPRMCWPPRPLRPPAEKQGRLIGGQWPPEASSIILSIPTGGHGGRVANCQMDDNGSGRRQAMAKGLVATPTLPAWFSTNSTLTRARARRATGCWALRVWAGRLPVPEDLSGRFFTEPVPSVTTGIKEIMRTIEVPSGGRESQPTEILSVFERWTELTIDAQWRATAA